MSRSAAFLKTFFKRHFASQLIVQLLNMRVAGGHELNVATAEVFNSFTYLSTSTRFDEGLGSEHPSRANPWDPTGSTEPMTKVRIAIHMKDILEFLSPPDEVPPPPPAYEIRDRRSFDAVRRGGVNRYSALHPESEFDVRQSVRRSQGDLPVRPLSAARVDLSTKSSGRRSQFRPEEIEVTPIVEKPTAKVRYTRREDSDVYASPSDSEFVHITHGTSFVDASSSRTPVRKWEQRQAMAPSE